MVSVTLIKKLFIYGVSDCLHSSPSHLLAIIPLLIFLRFYPTTNQPFRVPGFRDQPILPLCDRSLKPDKTTTVSPSLVIMLERRLM